jgi:hypothetical protein
MIVAIQKDLAGFIQTVRRVRLSSHCPLGFQARTSWGPHVRFRRVQTLVRERSPLVKAAQFWLGGLVASPVTATTDFLARDTLNRCGRAVRHPPTLSTGPCDRLRRDQADGPWWLLNVRFGGDIVPKVENRTTLKISRKLIFGLLCCCVAFQRHYGGL